MRSKKMIARGLIQFAKAKIMPAMAIYFHFPENTKNNPVRHRNKNGFSVFAPIITNRFE